MIGYFPEPYPDELFYSLCARFGDRMQYPGKWAVGQELFNQRSGTSVVDLPRYLGHLAEALPPGHPCRMMDRLINDHTLLPFYRPFQPLERLERIRNEMLGDGRQTGYTRTGLIACLVQRPQWLRFCPVCADDDRERFGEAYWHRLHQVPGVEVCPVHETMLENSEAHAIYRSSRYEFVPAERVITQTAARPLATSTSFRTYLLDLARDAMWLLCQPDLTAGPEALHQRYKLLLPSQGMATYAGVVKTRILLKAFRTHYPPEFLATVQCEIDEQIQHNWFVRITRSKNEFLHPVQHLLLIRFLGHTAETFFQLPTELQPFGTGPWPCLNHASPHYGEPRIEGCCITYDRYGCFVGTFSCSCGFVYSRRGPDRSDEDRFRIWRHKSFGSVWDEELKKLWVNPNMSCTEIGRQLGVDYSMVMRQAARLGLPSRGLGAMAATKGPMTAPTGNAAEPAVGSTTVQEKREQWLSVLQNHPEASRMSLRRQWPKLFAWLDWHDADWLAAHLPARRQSTRDRTKPLPARVNWAERDEQLAEEVALAAQRLLSMPGRPERITRAAIGRQVRRLEALHSELNKLPRTSRTLAEVMETSEEFVIRRVEWAKQLYQQEGICPTRFRFVERVGVHPRRAAKWPCVQAAIAEALQTLAQQSSVVGLRGRVDVS